jgi:hypothetical protein
MQVLWAKADICDRGIDLTDLIEKAAGPLGHFWTTSQKETGARERNPERDPEVNP